MKNCKNCGKKFEPQYNKVQNVCSFSCAIELTNERNKKTKQKAFKEMEQRVKAPIRKKDLQRDINKLSRLIDAKFNYKCIDCGKEYGKQVDAAHLHNSQGNENIRFNLHNLHSAKSDCNQYSSEHKVGYRIGLEKRYNKEYLHYVDFELPLKYKYIGLLDNEVVEKLKIVRKLIRTFDTYDLKDGKQAREMFNKIIGIYI